MAPEQPHPLVLASSSPRRADLLREAGYRFLVVPPPLEEPDRRHPRVSAASVAESLAYYKAYSVAAQHTHEVILAADTIAVIDAEVIGKPADEADARHILRRLSGTTHRVITGMALVLCAAGRRMLDHDISEVTVRPLSDADIDAYMATGAWRGKAGAYGVQEVGDAFVSRVSGSFTNVVGLPMERLARMFQDWLGR